MNIFQKLLGVNYKTTLAGITAIIAVVGKILVAYRTKDFSAIFSNGQELFLDITLLLTGLGLLAAKDNDTKGAGKAAVKVDDKGNPITP